MRKALSFEGNRTSLWARWVVVGAVLAAGVIVASCASVGREFPDAQVSELVIGKTTQEQVQKMFGSPWRVGLEDGLRTWTYGKYRYRLFGETSSKDLVIRFNEKDVVVSYSFNTTEHNK